MWSGMASGPIMFTNPHSINLIQQKQIYQKALRISIVSQKYLKGGGWIVQKAFHIRSTLYFSSRYFI